MSTGTGKAGSSSSKTCSTLWATSLNAEGRSFTSDPKAGDHICRELAKLEKKHRKARRNQESDTLDVAKRIAKTVKQGDLTSLQASVLIRWMEEL